MAGLLKSERLQGWAALLAGHYLRLALRSTRWTYEGFEHLAPFLAGKPVIIAFWHERLPLMPALFARARIDAPGRQVSVLVSRHRDGRLIGRAISVFGMNSVYGSAQNAKKKKDQGGAAALRALLGVLRAGDMIAITPDGPRGPRRVAQPGTASLAALSGVPIIACAAQLHWRVTLPSWDRMVLPLPFGRGAIICLPPLHIRREDAGDALPGIEASLSEAVARADRLCGAA